MASAVYNSFKKKIADGSIDLDTDTIKIALVTSSYTVDIDAHDFFDDITNETSGTGYSAGGATLASKVVTVDNTNDRAYFDADDATWSTSTITARGAVVYKSTGMASTSALICYIDFGSNITSTAATFTVAFHANGILLFT